MSEMPPPRVLFCAFAELPGPTGISARTQQWLSVFGNKSTDALCLKGEKDPHIQRVGGARVMRVPNTRGKPLAEQLSTYQRALARQLSGEAYDLIWCADLAAAPVIAQHGTNGAALLVEARGSPTPALAADAQKRQRDGERAVLKAAARVFVPTQAAARAWPGRNVTVVPYCVDRAVFSPPSVELGFDEDARVVVFGGREGGARLDLAVAALERIAARSPAARRLVWLGAPSSHDDDVRARLAAANLSDRIELVDSDAAHDAAAALSLAQVVIVLGTRRGDDDVPVLPHRALEAMACGRATVLAGAASAYEGTIEADNDLVVVAPEADRIAEAAVALIMQHGRREALMRAGARYVEAHADLETRAQEVEQIVRDATKVRLQGHPPRDDDSDTSSRSVPDARAFARAKPRPPLPPATPVANAAPPAEPSGPSAVVLTRVPEASATIRMEAPAFSNLEQAPGLWEGDTFLDGSSAPNTDSNPDAERVKAAMLVSSDADRDVDRSAPPSTLTSVKVASSMDSLEPPSGEKRDPWVNDTIADGSPLDTQRPASERAPQVRLPSAKSLLVDLAERRSDATAEEPDEQATSDEQP